MITETWYVIYSSRERADDWFRHSTATYDSLDKARKQIRRDGYATGFDFKITKVTHIEEDAELHPAPGIPFSEQDWWKFGVLLREATLDAWDGELIDSSIAYEFLLENPECFGRDDEWPENMPKVPPPALVDGYHSDPAHTNRTEVA